MSKKTPEEAHPLAPLLVECFTLANAFEALAKDARQDAEEAQAEMERLQAKNGFKHYKGTTSSIAPWNSDANRLRVAQNVIALCEGLVDSLRQNPLAVRDALDDLIRCNETAAFDAADAEVEPPNRKKNRRNRS
jgi:hypothetical protein